jgi:hypothetical protein
MSNPMVEPSFAIDTLRWAARVGSVISIGILLLFIIGEGFHPAKVAPREWVGLLFFPGGVVAGMIVGWWREGLGGAIAVASLLAFYLVYGFLLSGKFPSGAAFLVFAAPGFLFLTHWLLTRGAR